MGMAESSGDPTFAERFAYVRWLFYGRTGREPLQSELAERVDRSQPTVGEWYVREQPPSDYRVHGPMADYLGADREWLIDGAGKPPEPVLWRWWYAQRRGDQADAHPPTRVGKGRPSLGPSAGKGRARGA